MDSRNIALINKILEEIDYIETDLKTTTKEMFLASKTFQHSFTMALLNIGELAKGIDETFKESHPDIP